ncbi:MAG: HAD family phosphatase [Eubacteriales bacterium]|nr:HAD family phosphatase [Eubacteriales bacterium]
MAGFRGAIFDMDGTLLESMLEWRKQNIAFAQRHNIEIPEEFRGKEMEMSSHKACRIYAEKYPELGMNADEIEREYERALLPIYCNEIAKKKGLVPFLEMLRARGVKMCVATATGSNVAKQALEAHGLMKYMEFVISSPEMGMSKANPTYFPKVAQMLGVDRDDCAVFEDALYAVQSAHTAGMRVFAVEDWCARGGWEEIRRLSAVFRKDFEGLLPVVQAMFAADHCCTMQLAGGECRR